MKYTISFIILFMAIIGLAQPTPIAHWTLDETSGPVQDVTGNGHDGTNYNATRGVEGVSTSTNFAFNYDGSGDYTKLTNIALPSTVSLSFWLKHNYTSFPLTDVKGIFFKAQDTGLNRGLSSSFNSLGTFNLSVGTSDQTGLRFMEANTNISGDNNWHHIVAMKVSDPSGDWLKIYVDGILDKVEQFIGDQFITNTSWLEIGRASSTSKTTRYLDGVVDDIKLFNQELTATQVLNIYDEVISPPPGGPSLWTANGSKIYYNSGNVGIGTTNPLSLLSVNGLIRAEEIKVVTDVDVPDYVFEPDYPLRSLDDLRSYIHGEGHLPDIPSAAEIQLANGFELGDMDMRLLRKIEELTLYTLEQEKLLGQYKKKIENQEIKLLNQRSMISEILKRIEKLEIKL